MMKLVNAKDIFEKYNTDESFTFEAFVKPKYSGGHNKWITRYPKTNVVFDTLKKSFESNEIGYNWVTDHFGGKVAEFVTGIKQNAANDIKKHVSISWNEFIEKYAVEKEFNVDDDTMSALEWKQYSKPKVIDYTAIKNVPGLINVEEVLKIIEPEITNNTMFDESLMQRISKVHKAIANPNEIDTKNLLKIDTFIDFLENKASFRTLSNTQMAIYTDGNGVFTREGKIRINNPKEVGNFVCIISFDELNYDRDLNDVENLWAWRTSRNEVRGKYEEHFGYDVKHMSHLFRLLLGAIDILKTGTYKPRLSGRNLEFVRNVLRGNFEYDEMIDYADELETKLEEAYCLSKLPEKPNFEKANKLLLRLSK